MINYHRHSHYSNIILPDSVVTNEDYAKRAVELGHPILSSCEHGTSGAYRECYDLAKKYDLRWRYVAEAYFVKDRLSQDRTNAHMILAAKTEKGVYDLNEALSEANISGYYYRPRVDLDLLLRLDPKDVFLTTACVAGVWQYGYDKEKERYDWREPDELIRTLWSHFRGSMMLEMQAHDVERQRILNGHILDLYRQMGIPIICGLDSHFIYPEQEKLRLDFLASKHLVYEDEAGWYMDYPDDETVFARFKKQGVLSDAQIAEAMDNTGVFLDFEDVSFDKGRKLPTLYPEKTQEERNELYRQIIRDRWREYRKTVPKERWPEYLNGIKYEVDTICDTATSDYFLLDYEIVKRFKELGGQLTKSGRGSSPSYFTNNLLGFTSIDRFALPVPMLPDRFISKDRLLSGSLPDIDMNCGNPEVFAKAQEEVMGAWHSAPMVAFGTMKRLSSWKMYCRATDVPFETANTISDALKRYELDWKHADEEERDSISPYDYVPQVYHEQLRMSEKYLGLIDSISPHPCAYLLTNADIRREIGVFRINSKTGKKGTVFAAFIDGATADAFGYLKNDDLAVTVVKLNADIYRRIGIPQPDVPRLLEMTDGDAKTWDLYAKGYTLALNQAEREKSTEKVMRYKPRNITELSAFVAAIRPGFQSMSDKFLLRAHFDYGIPVLDGMLQNKYMSSSWLLYQESAMLVMQYAGFTGAEAYAAIKAIAKKKAEKVYAMRDRFLLGFSAKLREDDPNARDVEGVSAKVWQILEDSAFYSFNLSHSVAVALDSLYTAWAKAHHPLETYAAMMASYAERGDKDKIDRAKQEMQKAFGIRVVLPRFRQDNRDFFLDHDANTISDSLVSVKHLSKRVADALWRMRDNRYDTFVDLLFDMTMQPVFTTQSIEILIRLGYFEEFGGTAKLMSIFRSFFEDKDTRFSKSHVKATQEKRLDALRRIEKETPDGELPTAEKVSFETEVLGTPITVDPAARSLFCVLDVDAKFSPKLTLYNIASGTTGKMKVRKSTFSAAPLAVGNVIRMTGWTKKRAMRYENGKAVPRDGVFDNWLEGYEIVS